MFSKNKELFECIAKALKVNSNKININSSSDNIEDWDSLGQLNILTALDKKLKGKVFGIKKISHSTINKSNNKNFKRKKTFKMTSFKISNLSSKLGSKKVSYKTLGKLNQLGKSKKYKKQE